MTWRGCDSTRTLDRWVIHCNRGHAQHKIHHALLLEVESDRMVSLEWDDRPGFVSEGSLASLRADRAHLIAASGQVASSAACGIEAAG